MRGTMRLVLLTLINGCNVPVSPDQAYTKLKPKTWYRDAYEYVVKCAGPAFVLDDRQKPKVRFRDIDFYVIEAETVTVNGLRVQAYATGRDIFLTRPVVDSIRVVRHELLHVAAELWSHPVVPFYSCKLMLGQ